jgi:hypothetical protein
LRGNLHRENGDTAGAIADHALVFSFLPHWALLKMFFWLLLGLGAGACFQWHFNIDILLMAEYAAAATLIWFLARHFRR